MTTSMNPNRYEAWQEWLQVRFAPGSGLAPEDAEICVNSLAKLRAAEIFQQLRAQSQFLEWVKQQNAQSIWKGSFAPRQRIGKAKRDGDWVQLPDLKLRWEQQGNGYLGEAAMLLFLADAGYDLEEIAGRNKGHSGRACEGYRRYKVALPTQIAV